jgi:hypothetical protein
MVVLAKTGSALASVALDHPAMREFQWTIRRY